MSDTAVIASRPDAASLELPRGRMLVRRHAPAVMGIINVTPDSFSDGGVNFDRHEAVAAALRMEEWGAAIIDIGGESTRPGSHGVDVEEELRRVIPVIEAIRTKSDIPISIDTAKARVARLAVEAGADLVNDVSALRFDEAMAATVASLHVPVILMHRRGEPRTMQQEIHFDDLIAEIRDELRERRDRAVDAGIAAERILIDPGIGFGKTFDHNIEILARASEFSDVAPVVIGASRKAFVGHLTGQPGGAPRMAGSLAAVAAAVRSGAFLVRVHDVRETIDFLAVDTAVRSAAR